MKRISIFFTVISTIVFALPAQAKVWRINNTPGVTADFASPALALASASVLNDDTLHLEGSTTVYGGFTLSKRLVIIGTGYFLSGANSNTGLQANTNSASFGGGAIYFDSTSSGSTLIGLDNFYLGSGPSLGSATDNYTVTRCNVSGIGNTYGYTANSKMVGWKINKCYISYLSFSTFPVQNWEITNNIFTTYLDISSSSNLNNLVRNNIFRSSVSMYNGYFANNIIQNTTFTVTNVTVKNNISIGAPTGFAPYVGSNGNINNQTDAALFQGLTGNSTDGQWRLKTGSAAIGAGETVSSVTPDCGVFGTADPYVLSGIPAIPTIYLLTVPASVATSATTMPVTISTRSNN